MVIQN